MAYKLNIFEFKDDYVIIHITRRNGDKFEALIDLEDYDKIKDMCWHATWHIRSKWYYIEHTKYLGISNGKPQYQFITLHKFIMKSKEKEDVDHINGDTFDNRKSNLRVINHSDNTKNRQRKNRNNSTGYRNVTLYNGWYLVQLQINGKNTVLGKFKNVDEAGAFASEMRTKYYKEFAGADS